jgi:GNAT superfamily N-acetyltransferase
MRFIRPNPEHYGVLTDIDEQAYGFAYDWNNLPDDLAVRSVVYGEVAGFVSYRFVSGQVLEIPKLAVRETMRRLKVGSETIHWLVNKARESRSRFLRTTVFDSNIVGCHFLAHHGFEGKVLDHGKGLLVFTRDVVS